MTIDELKAIYGVGREKKKYAQKESELQQQCVSWFRYTYPQYIICAVPNGGSRNAIEAAKLKREGVLAGFADLIIVADHRILFVEMKTEKGRMQDSQKAFKEKVEKLGFKYVVCRSFDEFRIIVSGFLGSKVNIKTQTV